MIEFFCVIFFVVCMAIFLYCYNSYVNKKKEELGEEEYRRIRNDRKAESDARLMELNVQSQMRKSYKREARKREKEAKSLARTFFLIDILRRR